MFLSFPFFSRWRLSRNEAKDANFSENEPNPTPQLLKLFAEDYVATRKKVPSQKIACHNLISFTLSGGGVKRWVTIDPEFLKGFRYRDDATSVADSAFKGFDTAEEVLATRPPKGRES
ncbi:uncharacterized protein N7443_009816 [Penicillium atrosanguineum]|uniref:uncharacterized protein n=1 Tax=Penicillium atrosanguineum TaxID=1132637 RepID=UPI00239F28A5|nr:uncharacterized protein N7443_009816 [Penicillium atrosanguineum]KAJ5289563.1 hypothetical protein N7443_009816 [Penicillium atrosanguineum]